MFYTRDCFLRLVTFNSESYSVHVISLCVHVRVPCVQMRQLGGVFYNRRSFFRVITQKSTVSRRVVAYAHQHLKEEKS